MVKESQVLRDVQSVVIVVKTAHWNAFSKLHEATIPGSLDTALHSVMLMF